MENFQTYDGRTNVDFERYYNNVFSQAPYTYRSMVRRKSIDTARYEVMNNYGDELSYIIPLSYIYEMNLDAKIDSTISKDEIIISHLSKSEIVEKLKDYSPEVREDLKN